MQTNSATVTSAQNSRHIDRKLFKMRELRGAGEVVVRHIPTADNCADLFTKILSRQPFEKHRKVVLNSGAGESTDEVKQQRVAACDKAASRACERALRSGAWRQRCCARCLEPSSQSLSTSACDMPST